MNRAFAHSGKFCRFTHNNNLIAAEAAHRDPLPKKENICLKILTVSKMYKMVLELRQIAGGAVYEQEF